MLAGLCKELMRSPLDGAVFKVRTVTLKGDVWFVLSDICKVIEHTNPNVLLRVLDQDEWSKLKIEGTGKGRGQGEREVLCVSRSGLYRLLQRSDKPAAKPFQDWLAREVVPAIGGPDQGTIRN